VLNQRDSFERQVVYVIDNHPIVGFGFVELVRNVVPHACIRQFSSLQDAARHAVRELPVLVISDFDLDDVLPDAFIGLCETLFPTVPVLITSHDDELVFELQRKQPGRFVALSRSTPIPRLADHIRTRLSQTSVQVPLPRASSRCLTQKQVEVLELIGAGHTNKEIATQLAISVETVKGHVKEILERLNAKNRMEASFIYRQKQAYKSNLAEPSLLNI
jgi:DNA-binding NarL/FixJ family response regulator